MVLIFHPEDQIIGNRVRIPGSTRCCNLRVFQGNPATVELRKFKVPEDKMGRRSEKE